MADNTIDDELTAKEILEYFWADTCKATHNVDSSKFKYRVKKYETLITNLIAQEANKVVDEAVVAGRIDTIDKIFEMSPTTQFKDWKPQDAMVFYQRLKAYEAKLTKENVEE